MYKVELLKQMFENEHTKKSLRKFVMRSELMYDRNKNVFVIVNGDGRTEFNIDNCYDLLELFNKMFCLLVNGTNDETGKEGSYYSDKYHYIGRIGE